MTTDQWIQMGLLILQVITTIAAIIAIVQTKKANDKSDEAEQTARESRLKTERIEAELRRRQEDYEASEQYGKVKELIRPFEKSASKLGVLLNDSEATEREKRMAFMDAYNEYTDLYNEINSFCARVNNGTIVAENYMKNTVVPILKKKAITQVEYQVVLMDAAKKLKMPGVRKPDIGAFREYNVFLENRTTGVEKEKIMKSRKDAGL